MTEHLAIEGAGPPALLRVYEFDVLGADVDVGLIEAEVVAIAENSGSLDEVIALQSGRLPVEGRERLRQRMGQ